MAKRGGKANGRTTEGSVAPVLRCDPLPHGMNRGKEDAVLDMLGRWRMAAAEVARVQWRLFHDIGRLDPQADAATQYRKDGATVRKRVLDAIVDRYGVEGSSAPTVKRILPTPPGLVDPLAEAKAALGAAPIQMIRAQVVGMLESFLSNRRNDFVRLVYRSSVDERTRHMLFAVNKAQAWGRLDQPVTVVRDGARIVVPREIRLLARAIWRRVMSLHRRPSTKRIGMVLDQRSVTLLPARKAETFPYWLRLTFQGKAKPIEIPLRSYPYFEARKGERKLTVQVSQDRETKALRFGVFTDIGATCAERKADYAASVRTPSVALDFGLSTLFATERGDLLGRGFLKRLKALDATLAGIARHFQRSNPQAKLRDCARYRRHADRVRGFVDTEIGRVLNQLVETMRPGEFVLEELDFRSPDLSRRMNRLLANCGRKRIAAKLAALEQELGIASTLVEPAYTSRTCNGCGYVDARNRRTQARFACRWCGSQLHADVNAARNIGERRSRPIGSGQATRKRVLDALVSRHVERWPGLRSGRTGRPGAPADPRLANPYFKGFAPEARSRPTDASPAEQRKAA